MRAAWAIARHEVRRLTALSSPRVRWAVLAAALLLAASWPLVRDEPVRPEDGLYPAAVARGSPLRPALEDDARFRVTLFAGRPPEGAFAIVVDEAVRSDGTQRGRAAAAAASEAVEAWQERRLEGEADAAAAFPVTVNLVFLPRDVTAAAPAPPEPSASPEPGAPQNPAPAGPRLVASVDPAEGSAIGIRPREVEPPFPVRSLLLSFAFVIPMNFVAQLCAGSLLGERVRRRGLILLSSPHGPATILAGRVLPYAVASAAVAVAAGLATGTGATGLAAAFAIVAFLLAAAVVLGLVARSERELTFLLTGATTGFSTFLFLPALFGAIPPVAYLSPITVVAASIQGEAVAWPALLYAVLPTAMAAATLAILAVGLFREETLFSVRGPLEKGLEGLARQARRAALLVPWGILLVPFAMALELFVLALLIPLGLYVLFPAFVLGTAAIEEVLKRAATASHRRASGGPAWRAGLLVGSGFFLGEKLALVVALVGFGDLLLGRESLELFGIGTGLAILAFPLALHAVTAIVGALGDPGKRLHGRLAWLGATALHASYNAVLLLGGFA